MKPSLSFTVFSLPSSHVCGLACGLLLTLPWGQVGISAPIGKSSAMPNQKMFPMGVSVENTIRYNPENRRDPFSPIPQIDRSISIGPAPSVIEPKTSPRTEAPNWKLLGIIYAQFGRQAIIQISPKERFLVGSGEELASSGWMVRAIDEDHVVLENPSLPFSEGDSSKTRRFTLFFPSH